MTYSKEDLDKFLADNTDVKYKEFHSRLTRSNYPIHGVRVPILRAYGKELAKCENVVEFLQRENSQYEIVILKGIVLSSIMKKSDDFALLEKFLLEIDDWAVCDVSCGGLKRKDKVYLDKCLAYAKSKHIWTARWGIVAFMTNFCDKPDEL
ncbi:MAG: hypothetical protein HDT29_02995 [Clostridiales bacterium]|nr:hypothetical protein [Clostridiales bacterium]